MHIQDFSKLLLQQLTETPLIQWIGVSFGVTEVFLAKANNILLYPAGLVSTSISIFTLFQAGLFAESALNLYYFSMSIYGWWFWIHRKNNKATEISKASTRDWQLTGGITVASFLILYFVLANFTPSTVPAWDAWVSATAWAGMWLLAKRKVENWILLNVSNIFAIPLLFHKDLALYAMLTIILFIVAILGYMQWRKTLNNSTPNYSL